MYRIVCACAVVAAGFAVGDQAPAAPPKAQPPTLEGVKLEGAPTAWSGTRCDTMSVTGAGRAFGSRPKRGRFTSTTDVTFSPGHVPFEFGPLPLVAFGSEIHLRAGPRRVVATLARGVSEVEGRCSRSPGGERGRATGTVDYTATITTPHGTFHDSGTATVDISALQGNAPGSPLGEFIRVRFDSAAG
jgi:hypothetical protein